jgi:hypothetical protein
MLLASPASLKDTLKSEHVEDSATGVARAFAALAHTDAPKGGSTGKFNCHFRDVFFWKSHLVDPMQVVNEKLRDLGPWKPGERTEQKLGWLASFVVSEVVATHNNNFEVKEWASKFFQTLSKAMGKERLTFLEFG